MDLYSVNELVFVTVANKKDNHYHLAITNNTVKRAYFPTLNEFYSYEEIEFGEKLSEEASCKSVIADFVDYDSFSDKNLSVDCLREIEEAFNRHLKSNKKGIR